MQELLDTENDYVKDLGLVVDVSGFFYPTYNPVQLLNTIKFDKQRKTHLHILVKYRQTELHVL